ncbi:hypothetical protein ACR6C2_25970 [Streptomyces sp. INA 01156]
MLAISLGVSLVVVDFTIVNVVMPPIIDDLEISAFDAQWIQSPTRSFWLLCCW